MMSWPWGRRSMGKTRPNRSSSSHHCPAIWGVSDEVAHVSMMSGSPTKPPGAPRCSAVKPSGTSLEGSTGSRLSGASRGYSWGVGFLTYLAHGTLVVVAVAATGSGEPLVGAALLAPFGLARGLSVLVAVGARRPQEGSALVARLARSASSPGWRAAHVAALLAVGVAAAAKLPTSELPVAPLAAAALGAAFGWSAGAKIARPASWRRVLGAHELQRWVQRASLIGVPVAEVAIVGLVVMGMHRTAGFVALVILAAFSAAILRARRRFGDVVTCGCFGTSVARDYRILLLRNALLAGGAAIAAFSGVDAPRISVPGLPSAGDALPAALAVTGIAVAAWMLASSLRSFRVRRIA